MTPEELEQFAVVIEMGDKLVSAGLLDWVNDVLSSGAAELEPKAMQLLEKLADEGNQLKPESSSPEYREVVQEMAKIGLVVEFWLDKDATDIAIELAGQSGRTEMVSLIRAACELYTKIKTDRFYPGPTALARIQAAFGELEPDKRDTFKPYIGPTERLLVWSGVFRKGQQPTVQYELPGLANESELAKVDKRIYELLDPLALKVFHAILYIIYKQGHGDMAYWDINEILDILDYKRSKRGYHESDNVKRVKERFELLSELVYKAAFFGYGEAEGYTLDFENKLISLEPDNRVSLYQREKLLYRRCVVRLDRKLFDNMVKQKMFAWFDVEFLKLHPQRHKRAILLYSYYCCQLSMGAPGKARRGQPVNVVKRNIDTVLRETGIEISSKNRGQDMRAFSDAHTELKSRGLIRDFSLSLDMAEITFHESHPALTYQTRETLPE